MALPRLDREVEQKHLLVLMYRVKIQNGLDLVAPTAILGSEAAELVQLDMKTSPGLRRWLVPLMSLLLCFRSSILINLEGGSSKKRSRSARKRPAPLPTSEMLLLVIGLVLFVSALTCRASLIADSRWVSLF